MLASTFLLDGLTTKANYDLNLYAALALLALFGGFVFGGLATGLALMLIGVPIARFAGDNLEKPEGTITSFVAAAICVAAFKALGNSNEPFWALAAACFALPATILYRRQILLERAFEHP